MLEDIIVRIIGTFLFVLADLLAIAIGAAIAFSLAYWAGIEYSPWEVLAAMLLTQVVTIRWKLTGIAMRGQAK